MALMYQYPRCSTCQKALKWVRGNDLNIEVKDLILETPSKDELVSMIKASGLPVKKFFNTSGKIYKERNLKEKVDQLSIEEAAEMLAGEGMLIKRPLIIDGDLILVGFNSSQYEEKLLR